MADDEETWRVLLQLGANTKLVTSRYDGTALIAAAHLSHNGVVKQLIAAGVLLDHVNCLIAITPHRCVWPSHTAIAGWCRYWSEPLHANGRQPMQAAGPL